ncbi:MAG TPA: hypothetical protein VGP08_04950 [Pyrinomonadaceae bacterium]|jgi:hypothetical protein|nr:hypothetical protein [Pyrinomonadaceae bacterium]
MHKRARGWSIWLQAGILLSILAGASYWLAQAGGTSLDREALKSAVGELRSQAAVGRLLAEQSARGELTRTFLETQVGQSRKNIDSERKELKSSSVAPEVIGPSMRASTLARRLDDDYAALALVYGDGNKAEVLGREFDALFKEFKTLEEGLGE